jgi:hypothetical protein
VSWSGLDGRCIRIHRFSLRIGRRRAFHRRISNNREWWLITKLFVQTIFRFLIAGKGSGVSEIETNTPAIQTCFSALQRSEMGRIGLRHRKAHDRKTRTNIRVGSKELEAMVALEYIYGLCERVGSLSERGGDGREQKPKTDCFIPLVIFQS